MQDYEVLSTTYYNTTSCHYEEIESSVAWYLPIKLHKPTIASDPTHCECAHGPHDMSIRPIQVEVTLYNLFRSKPIPEAEMSNRLIHLVFTIKYGMLPQSQNSNNI